MTNDNTSIDDNQVKILIDNNHYGVLVTEPSIFKLLAKLLSFKEAGIEFSPKYKNSRWDGITYLLTKNGRFSLGLLETIKNWCAENEVKVEITDSRKAVPRNAPIDILPALQAQGRSPRDYQIEAANIAINSPMKRNILRIATSGGKSIIICLIAAAFNTKTIIYVPSLDLLNQFHKDMSALFSEKIGYIGNGVVDIQRINVATVWTLGSALGIDKKTLLLDDSAIDELSTNQADKVRINKLLKETELHIIDECHVSSCSTLQSIYKAINPVYLFGLSGTPLKGTENDLLTTSMLGSQAINISASELIKKGVVVRPFIKYLNVPKIHGVGENYQEVYKTYVVENDVRNDLIIAQATELINKNYTVLVLFKSIKHGQILVDKFQAKNIPVEFLSGKDSTDHRDMVKEKVMDGKANIVIASQIYDVGVSIERLSALILAGSGKSYVKTLQRIGRVIRGWVSPTGEKKGIAVVVEFFDNCKYLKQHSLKRYEIYATEPEFKLVACDAMKKLI